ncbi:MAG: hypothetical protein Q4F69_11745 [Bacteroidia bacterium]|nr:hypothetical protein [Bacteroidia bacterium]
MKKSIFIVSAFALLLGLSQCKKPDVHTYCLDTTVVPVRLETGNGTKGNFVENNLSHELNYFWNENDKIHVYATTSAEGTFDAAHALYCGALELIEIKEGGTDAVFSSKSVKMPVGAKKVRFFHYGASLGTSEEGFDGAISADYSVQTGSLADVSAKVVAMCETNVKESQDYTIDGLDVMFAVAKLSFQSFGGSNMSEILVFDKSTSSLNVDAYGTVTYSGSTTVKLSDAASAKGNNYYAIFMPDNGAAKTLTFYANNQMLVKSLKFTKNYFYSNNGDPCIFKADKQGLVPGKFSVSASKKVYFSQGNLQWKAKNSDEDPNPLFRFAGEQYQFLGKDGYDNVKSGNPTYDNRNTQKKPIDWFGYGCTGAKISGIENPFVVYRTSNWNEPLQVGVELYPYGNLSSGADAKYRECNWGVHCKISNGGNKKELWDILSVDEWNYLIGGRAKAGEKWGYATINSVKCIVLLSDNFTLPSGLTFNSGKTGGNTYNKEQWRKMENNGAVALPAAEYMYKKIPDGKDTGQFVLPESYKKGYYWTKTSVDNKNANAFKFNFDNKTTPSCGSHNKMNVSSVRLVCKAN